MVRFLRFFLGAIVLLGVLATAKAFDETRDAWIRGVFTGHSPRAARLAESAAWREAIEVVSRTPGAFILVGTGRSMQPLYPAGTLLVLRETPYGELRSGQTVVYRNANYRAVGHTLVAKARDGWRVRGLNNWTHDMEPVTEEKLIGVVIAAFTPVAEGKARATTAQRRRAGTANFLSETGR
jgi:hypothetical protein